MGFVDTRDIAAVRGVLDDLYADGPNNPVSRGRIVEEIERLGIQDDLMNYFAKLRNQDFTRQELVDTIDGMILADGRDQELGLIH